MAKIQGPKEGKPILIFTKKSGPNCHTLILSGDYHSWILLFSLADLSCSTPVTVQNERSFDVLVKDVKIPKGRGKTVMSGIFLGPGSLGPPNSLGVK